MWIILSNSVIYSMQQFSEIEVRQQESEVPCDKYLFQKQRLLFNLTRSKEVCDAVYSWLISFQGGISKETFMGQISRLSFDDSEAIEQLSKSMGKRSIVKVRKFQEPLPSVGDVIQRLANDELFIAVNGREKQIKSFVRNTYQTLKDLGKTFVLDINELRLEWAEKYKKGRGQDIIQNARDCDFLIIIGFEAPMDLAPWIVDWWNSLRRYRIENSKPMIMLFGRFMERTDTQIWNYFKKYKV